jgi:hypothetical protein
LYFPFEHSSQGIVKSFLYNRLIVVLFDFK